MSDELAHMLRTLEPRMGNSKWSSFYQAIVCVWNTDKIRDIQEKIESYQRQLVFRLLVCLDAKIDHYAAVTEKHLQKLEYNDLEILEVIGFNQNKLLASIKDETFALREDIDQGRAEIMSAILKLKNGEIKLLAPEKEPTSHTPYHRYLYDQRLARCPETVTRFQARAMDDTEVSLSNFSTIQRAVLRCPRFRYMGDRVDSVRVSHKNTCDWISSNPQDIGKPWSNFPEWLKNGHGCYWINGKAGSGKSTLMKFVFQHCSTRNYLSQWTQGRNLALASAFLWNLGPNSNVRSLAGILRSFLYDVIESHPALTPLVLPDLCQDVSETRDIDEPTLHELKRWFRQLCEHANE
jgi:hypothetical protein